MKKRWTPMIALVLAVAGLVAAGGFLIARKRARLARAPRFEIKALPVHAAAVRRGDLARTREYLAVVEPRRRADISSRLAAATVEQVLCDEGDKVERGQVLIVLDDRELRDRVEAVTARMAQAAADLAANRALVASLEKTAAFWRREAERDRVLAAKKDIAASQAERTRDRADEAAGKLLAARQRSHALEQLVKSLKHERDTLVTRLGYARIRSPYAGLVTRRLVDPGDLASPGKKLLVVEDRSRVKLAFDVPQTDLREVKEGDEVRFPAAGGTRRARITHLYPSLDAARMLRAECELPPALGARLRLGSYFTVTVVCRRLTGVLLVPRACIVEGGGRGPCVFVVRDGRLAHLRVRVLARGRELAAVEGLQPGLEPGVMVVTNTFLGWSLLSSGLPAEVLP